MHIIRGIQFHKRAPRDYLYWKIGQLYNTMIAINCDLICLCLALFPIFFFISSYAFHSTPRIHLHLTFIIRKHIMFELKMNRYFEKQSVTNRNTHLISLSVIYICSWCCKNKKKPLAKPLIVILFSYNFIDFCLFWKRFFFVRQFVKSCLCAWVNNFNATIHITA